MSMLSMRPWNDWYHCMSNTYGTWLPADKRGFRTRHHREHVEGDYKHPPPPGTYDKLLARSRRLLSRTPVYLTIPQRCFVCCQVVESLRRHRIEVIVVSLDSCHLHILARFRDHDPRHHIGVAKRESSYYLRAQQDGPASGIWATRSECLPVHDRQHRLKVVDYIKAHKDKDAAVWFLGRLL